MTELLATKVDLWKTRVQLFETQVREGQRMLGEQRVALETEVLKDSPVGSTWNWDTMSVVEPPKKDDPPQE